MKKRSLFITFAVVIVAATVAFVSCKKEQVPIAQNQDKSTLARIKDFKRLMEEVEANPNERTVSYISIPDAVWNIEALFNYTYANPNNFYGQTVCCDTTLYLPVCSNDSVSLVDLNVFNGQMYEAVLSLYQAVVLDNKRFLILDVEAGVRNGNLQAIELHTVQGSMKGEQPQIDPPHPWAPFAEGFRCYYGEDQPPVDAADTLSSLLNAILVKKAPEGSEYIYTQIKHKYTQVGETHANPYPGYPNVSPRYCEFYKVNPTMDDCWLNSDQLNYYYFGERSLVLDTLPNDANDPLPARHALFQVIVEDFMTNRDNIDTISIIGHHVTAYYGYCEAIQDSTHIWNL